MRELLALDANHDKISKAQKTRISYHTIHYGHPMLLTIKKKDQSQTFESRV
jgi:hypothetical protein